MHNANSDPLVGLLRECRDIVYLMKVIKNRRSIRDFMPNPMHLGPGEIEFLVDAARWAPSWCNTNPTRILWVDNPVTILHLAQALSEKNAARKSFANALAVAVFCNDLEVISGQFNDHDFGDERWTMHDLGMSLMNFCLAVSATGLGSVCVGAFDPNVLEDIIGDEIPTWEAQVLVPIGVPAPLPPGQEIPAPPRPEMNKFLKIIS